MNKDIDILEYSNPEIVFKKAREIFGKYVNIQISTRPKKKYMIFDPVAHKYVHFGQMGYQDYTRSRNPIKRHLYLKRASAIKGNWKDNPYSPNNLSINLLW